MQADLMVQPDPAFPLSDADRAKRNTAIMGAYRLQQQLVPARDALLALNRQLAAMRQYLTAAGDAGKAALALVETADSGAVSVQTALNRTLNAARGVQGAMDGYDGLPTEAQLRQLDWAWEDATANTLALNKLVGESMPGVYAALGSTVQWPKITPVAGLVR